MNSQKMWHTVTYFITAELWKDFYNKIFFLAYLGSTWSKWSSRDTNKSEPVVGEAAKVLWTCNKMIEWDIKKKKEECHIWKILGDAVLIIQKFIVISQKDGC